MMDHAQSRCVIAPGSPLVHVHIPKTAGSTFNGILRRQFPAETIYEYPSYFNFSGLDKPALLAAAREKTVILGHLDISCLNCLPARAVCVSFLRDPVNRVVSGYFNIVRDPSNPAHNAVKEMSLSDYVRSDIVRDVDNGMVRRLLPSGMDIPTGSLTVEHLLRARGMIAENDIFIGITEQFDESLLLLAHRTGTVPWMYLSVNVRPKAGGIDPAIARLILDRNQLDSTLYREQRARLAQELSCTPGLQQQLGRFRTRRKWFALATLPATLGRRFGNRLRRHFG